MDESEHHKQGVNPWVLGALGAAGAIIAAPHILPLIGIGDGQMAQNAIDIFHAHGTDATGGIGLAGLLNSGLGQVPLIGPALAAGGWGNIAATGIVGIGGMLLANWLEKHESAGQFHWSKVIRYASLATSALIALPAVLTGISVGITFLMTLMPISGTLINQVVAGLSVTTGSASMASAVSGGSGFFAAILPHLLSCGMGFIIPAGLSLWMTGRKSSPSPATTRLPTVDPEMQLVNATPSPITQGAPTTLAFRLVDANTGKTLSADALAVTHTEKLHTMIVDRSLTDYHHLHPVYDPARQLFICHLTPRLQQPYSAWHDFTLAGAADSTHRHTELPAARGIALPPSITATQDATAEGLSIHIASEGPLRAGQAGMLTLDVRDASGHSLHDLEPVMGSYAHLAGFSADGTHFIHCHPLGDSPATPDARGDGRLMFHITPESAGMTKFFLQIKRNGEEVVIPFGQRVLAPQTHVARMAAPAMAGGAPALG